VILPKKTEYIESKKYLEGFKLTGDKRALNDLEIGILHHNLQSNNVGLQLITGSAQCAQTKDARQYFLRGKKLAQKQIDMIEEILQEGDVHFSRSSVGTVQLQQHRLSQTSL